MDEISSRFDQKLSAEILDLSNDKQTTAFLYSKLLLHVVLHLPHDNASKQQLFSHVKKAAGQLNNYSTSLCAQFEHEYSAEQVVWWYTQPSFLYWQLNTALRKQEINGLYETRHYIVDLQDQIRALHLNFDAKVLYRGVTIQNFQLQKLEQSIGKLIHFSEFLSTSVKKEVAMGFMKPEVGNTARKIDNTMKAVLFHIDVSSRDDSLALEENFIGCIKELSQKPAEDEVLFSPNSVFRLERIQKGEDTVHNIYLRLTNERDANLEKLYQYYKEEIGANIKDWMNLVILGKLIRRMGKFQIAIHYYQMALEDETWNRCERYKTTVFTDLCLIYRQIQEYDKALEVLDKATESVKQGEYEWFARPYRMIVSNRAMVFKYKRDFEGACASYEELLKMEERAADVNNQERATTLSNLGCMYTGLGLYDLAMTFFERALSNQKDALPENHIEIGRTYSNMSTCWFGKGDPQKAEGCAQKALEIKLRSMMDGHQSVAYTKENLAMAQIASGLGEEAYNNLEEADEILQEQYPPNDLHRQTLKAVKDSIVL
ncbi:unnamed protein product [Rotaria magnacalcarata]|uniref:NAD(P)(+)--arginine ADP-ribosyltransferase n=3 Tax=Rotaria magnacalcarata TaxID=392030 RepID=A0A814YGD8_9BILA|nr:unnamed protein product [Rotaria magnacalcarata]CAF4023775.1 unnamed protein product [Rotaria magnacalcarata]